MAPQAAPGERVGHQIGARESLDERRAFRDQQHDRAINRGITDYRLGVFALRDRLDIVRKRRRIMTMPRSLGARYSRERSVTRPCPTQVTKSWFIT